MGEKKGRKLKVEKGKMRVSRKEYLSCRKGVCS